jgi:hypothetical protein
VKVFVMGAGLVGAMVVEVLHAAHDVTVVDLEHPPPFTTNP